MESALTFFVHRAALSILAVAFVSGCATIPADSGSDPRDPLESFNRQVFEFNDGFDRVFLKPVAQVYEYLPEPIRDCLSNAFSNFREPSNACRCVGSSTVGLLGCFEVARQMGLGRHNEDAGQTMGAWGIGSGPYLV